MASCSFRTMDKSTISVVIKKLESNSQKEVFLALKEIRKNVIKTSIGIRLFHECGGLKSVVRFLDVPNQKTLDISLSILGNCCLDYEFRKEAGDLNISLSVISILLNISTDSIITRACRVLGNLAQDYAVARQLHENGAVRALLTTIPIDGNGTSSPSTRQMAVRALGALWTVPDRRVEMLRMNVVQSVALLLTNESPPQLLETVLKTLVIFTRSHSQQCALQVNADGTGFQRVVSSVSNASLKEYALACICNLCNVASSRPLLGNAGAVDVLVEELKETSRTQFLHALCLLSRESGNRTRIRLAGGLQILLTESRNQVRCLKSLEHYIYDEPSIELLLSIGLLPMLVELLSKCRNVTIRSRKTKRKHHSETVAGFCPSNTSPNCRCKMSPSMSPYMSPGSSSSSPSYSGGSPSSSIYMSDEEDEENYSPVCSGDDSNSETAEKNRADQQVLEGWEAGPILIMLARISHIETPVVNMATSETLGSLLDYLTHNSDPLARAGRILARICRNPLYFTHILLAGFVPRLHSQLLPSSQADLGVSLLAQLSLLAESGFGEGEITHHLLKAQQKHKEIISITIPHLIKTPRLLKKLLLDCNGLAILMQVFEQTCDEKEEKSEDVELTSSSLYVLASTLNMSVTIMSTTLPSRSKTIAKTDGESVVSFKLDDGTQVTCDKTLLCQQSPYFEAMFRGDFCESQQQCISLPDVSKQCFQNIIQLLQKDEIPIDISLLQALELMKALDRFLIPSEQRLTDTILRLLTFKTAKLVYEQTVIAGDAPVFTFLKLNTLKYIMSTEMDCKVRTEMFMELRSRFGREFISNLECIIKTEIDNTFNRMYRMRCKKTYSVSV